MTTEIDEPDIPRISEEELRKLHDAGDDLLPASAPLSRIIENGRALFNEGRHCDTPGIGGVLHDLPVIDVDESGRDNARKIITLMALHNFGTHSTGDLSRGLFCWMGDPTSTDLPRLALVRVGSDDKYNVLVLGVGHGDVLLQDLVCLMKYRKDRAVHQTLVPASLRSALVTSPLVRRYLPHLEGVTAIPRWSRAADGSLHVATRKAYDPTTRTVLAVNAGVSRTPEPSKEEVDAALRTIGGVLGDFPYDSEASQANAYAFLLTAAMRPAFGSACGVLIHSDVPGAGKTLLAKTVHAAIFGHAPATFNAGGSPRSEHASKGNVVNLVGLPNNFYHRDEAERGSDALSSLDRQLLTNGGDAVKVRPVYGREAAALPSRLTMVLTMNEPRLGFENRRRVMPIGLAKRHDRDFIRTSQQMIEDASKSHLDVHQAIVTLVDHWVAVGSPMPDAKDAPESFEEWYSVMHGILGAVGIKGFLANRDEEIVSSYEEALGDLRKWVFEHVPATKTAGPLAYITAQDVVRTLMRHREDDDLNDILLEIDYSAPEPKVKRAAGHLLDALERERRKALSQNMRVLLDANPPHAAAWDGTVVRARVVSDKSATGVLGGRRGYAITDDVTVRLDGRSARHKKEEAP